MVGLAASLARVFNRLASPSSSRYIPTNREIPTLHPHRACRRPAQKNLRRGDVATIVEQYSGCPGQEPSYELEVFNALGDTLAAVTIRESQIEPLQRDEVFSVRPLAGVVS